MGKQHPYTGDLEAQFVRDELYGRWQVADARELSYAPGPKRRTAVPCALGPNVMRLLPWELPETLDARSVGYEGSSDYQDPDKLVNDEQPEHGQLELL
jgi:hypothetical protein